MKQIKSRYTERSCGDLKVRENLLEEEGHLSRPLRVFCICREEQGTLEEFWGPGGNQERREPHKSNPVVSRI